MLDKAFVSGSLDLSELDAKVNELNQMMLDHFNLASIQNVKYEHMSWLRAELAKNRISSHGQNFEERSRLAISHATKRKLNHR